MIYQNSFTPAATLDTDIHHSKHCINLALPTLVPVLNSPVQVFELRVCLRFILAACSLEVVYTGKIAITVDTKKNMTVSNGYNNTSSL